jgi:hypothetical protein
VSSLSRHSAPLVSVTGKRHVSSRIWVRKASFANEVSLEYSHSTRLGVLFAAPVSRAGQAEHGGMISAKSDPAAQVSFHPTTRCRSSLQSMSSAGIPPEGRAKHSKKSGNSEVVTLLTLIDALNSDCYKGEERSKTSEKRKEIQQKCIRSSCARRHTSH